jgi:NAD(P)-dependent dehydrogenase (short-subunit alcohol dehydrogenase family)
LSVGAPATARLGFISGEGPLVDALAGALAPQHRIVVPDEGPDPWAASSRASLDTFRVDLASAPPLDAVVVCTWPAIARVAPAIAIDVDSWTELVERPIARWTSALVGAVQRCADGGSVVAVVELPAALDVAGHLAHVVVGEAISTHARSLALAEGRRGVRVNVVSTQLSSAPVRPMGSPPPLASFPGRAEHEVAGAVRLLLDPASSGITGTVVRADCGRAW